MPNRTVSLSFNNCPARSPCGLACRFPGRIQRQPLLKEKRKLFLNLSSLCALVQICSVARFLVELNRLLEWPERYGSRLPFIAQDCSLLFVYSGIVPHDLPIVFDHCSWTGRRHMSSWLKLANRRRSCICRDFLVYDWLACLRALATIGYLKL